ncbi:hypothetical protein GCK32_007393 [Trichostrongylus colubriformis]|uniref:Major sperm protein n=1 Tax=Trichostrongylus colubriformis TaxID=6319 RepID=A0AAN8FN67_TRICO
MSRVNVNALKEIKDLKEPPQEQQPNVCPPFLQQPTTTEAPARLVAINPLIIVFDGPPGSQCQKTLNITNSSNDRVAWRILTNAPTRYVVSPNKGFLFKQEKISLTWRDMSPTDTKFLQSTRVSTLNPSAPSSTAGSFCDKQQFWGRSMGGYIAKVIATTPACNGGIGADDVTEEVAIVRKNGVTKVMNGALYRYGLVTSSASSISQVSERSAGNSTTSTSASASAISEVDHGEYAPKIKELTEAVKQAAEQKQINTQRMVAAVNEVKKLEVELDRAGQNLNQVQQKYNEQEETVAMLRTRLKKVREQLTIAREADRRRSNN